MGSFFYSMSVENQRWFDDVKGNLEPLYLNSQLKSIKGGYSFHDARKQRF
jgi:hypothetical protein